jgi:tRNA(fMet)-specific endonuclease VapC
MSYLLDTNILSAHIRRAAGLTHRFLQHSGRLYTSTVSLAELFVWAFQRRDAAAAVTAIDQLLHYEVGVIVFDQDCAENFARTRVGLRKQGIAVSSTDLMIASVALTHDLTLVTHNTDDFLRIPALRLEDWLSA